AQDRRHYVLLLVAAGLPEPRQIADVNLGHLFDLHWDAIRLRQDDVLDVLDLVALRQILGATAVQQADAADVHGLLPEADGPATHIGIGIADRADHLRQRDVVGVELVQIDLDLELLGSAAPGVDLDDTLHRQQPALHNPILDRAQIGQAEVRRSDQLVAVNFADQARALN